MRVRALFASCALAVFAACAHAQTAAGTRPELALTYSYTHANAPAGECGCFSLNGGGATFVLPHRHFAWVGDLDVTHGSLSGSDLTLTTLMGGARYQPRFHWRGLRPYGQVLAGWGHASGSLTGGDAFAGTVGGGVDLGLTQHLGLRLVEADYLATTFANGTNDHQNNVRITAGVLWRF